MGAPMTGTLSVMIWRVISIGIIYYARNLRANKLLAIYRNIRYNIKNAENKPPIKIGVFIFVKIPDFCIFLFSIFAEIKRWFVFVFRYGKQCKRFDVFGNTAIWGLVPRIYSYNWPTWTRKLCGTKCWRKTRCCPSMLWYGHRKTNHCISGMCWVYIGL